MRDPVKILLRCAAFGTGFGAVTILAFTAILFWSHALSRKWDEEPLVGIHSILQAKQSEEYHWGTAAFRTPYAEDLSPADKVAGLSLLWAEAKFGFANFWHVPELGWDKSYREFLPQVLATHSTAEYYRVLQRFFALLKAVTRACIHPSR